MKNEYEIIEHKYITGIQLFVVSMLYRTPHMHRDHELLLILKGSIRINSSGAAHMMKEGDMILFNPFQIHELQASEPALILSLQMSQDFFSDYFPQVRSIRFETSIRQADKTRAGRKLREGLLDTAEAYLKKETMYELVCASGVNRILHQCLELFPWKYVQEGDLAAELSREKRIRELTDRIDRHSADKLLLTDIAREMGVNVYYLSHFFSENFGMSFQKYLSRIRCEKARRQLLLTDQSLLTISIASGFSDPKYFNRDFREQYGVSPKEYRKTFSTEDMALQQSSILTTQEFLSDEASLVLLERAR